jgi:hypothetical protein
MIFVAAIAVTAAWNFTQSKGEVELSDFALENVEALAQETGAYPCDICIPPFDTICFLIPLLVTVVWVFECGLFN